MLERVCRKGTLLPCWWECRLEHHNRKHFWRFLKKLKIELLYDLAIPFPGIYPEKAIIRKDTCTPMFVIALFTIAKTWKQRKCPLTDEWIKKTWYIHTVEYYSTIGKQWNKAISSNMDGPRDYHIKWSKSDKDKYRMISLICGIFSKKIQMNLFTKQKQTHRLWKQIYGYKREDVVGRDKIGVWD